MNYINSIRSRHSNYCSNSQENDSVKSMISKFPKWSLPLSQQDSMKRLMLKGLNYQFSLKDLPKYSQRLKDKDLDNRYSKSALGKRIPSLDERIKLMQEKNRKLRQQSLMDKLKQDALNNRFRDWGKSQLYYSFQKYGRNVKQIFMQKKQNEFIYSEMENDYYISVLKKIGKKKYYQEMTKEEFNKLISQHFNKATNTLKVLMNSISLGYFYEKLHLEYGLNDSIEQKYNHFNTMNENKDLSKIKRVIKIMIRCKKMYECIESILLIFFLIHKIQKLKENKEEEQQQTIQRLEKRLLDVIKLLHQEHKIFQKAFLFKGINLLEELESKVSIQY